jgi:Mg-chelatase subunit ChlI
MKHIPVIQIHGRAGTGKSCLAFAIKDLLEKNGISVGITGCEDEKPGVMESTWQDRLNSLKGTTVLIATVQLPIK